MSLIAERLNSYETNFWDFKDDRPKGIHTIAKYPATMVAPMQYKLLIENYNAFPTLDLANKARDLSKQERKKLLIEYNNYNGIEIILNDKEKQNGE